MRALTLNQSHSNGFEGRKRCKHKAKWLSVYSPCGRNFLSKYSLSTSEIVVISAKQSPIQLNYQNWFIQLSILDVAIKHIKSYRNFYLSQETIKIGSKVEECYH